MVERQIIADTENYVMYNDNIEDAGGKLTNFKVLGVKKTKNYMKDEKGRSMYNVHYEQNVWINPKNMDELIGLLSKVKDNE